MLNKITFVGSGDIGAQSAFLTAQKRIAKEIVLVDIVKDLAMGRAIDIAHSLGADGKNHKVVGTDDYQFTDSSDVIVVSAGKAIPASGEYSRDELLQSNINIFRAIFDQLSKYNNKDAVVIIITNPVDVLTTWVHRNTEFSEHKIIGFGNMLDSLRYQHYSGLPNALVLGEHGDGMVLHKNDSAEVANEVIYGAKQVIQLLKNRSTMFAPSFCIAELVEAIALDAQKTLPVSVLTHGEYGHDKVCIGMPAVVGRKGIIEPKISELELSATELDKIKLTAEKIANALAIK